MSDLPWLSMLDWGLQLKALKWLLIPQSPRVIKKNASVNTICFCEGKTKISQSQAWNSEVKGGVLTREEEMYCGSKYLCWVTQSCWCPRSWKRTRTVFWPCRSTFDGSGSAQGGKKKHQRTFTFNIPIRTFTLSAAGKKLINKYKSGHWSANESSRVWSTFPQVYTHILHSSIKAEMWRKRDAISFRIWYLTPKHVSWRDK